MITTSLPRQDQSGVQRIDIATYPPVLVPPARSKISHRRGSSWRFFFALFGTRFSQHKKQR